MKDAIIKIFLYIEPLWMGTRDKISVRRILAIAFSIDFILNDSYAIRHWGEGKSFGELSSVLLIEAGLIAALLALTTYTRSLDQTASKNKEKIQG